MTYILSIDQGTTSTRALLFSLGGEIVKIAQKELPLTTPHNGWVEQDPEQIWNDVCEVVREVVTEPEKIRAIGITNQRETTVVWNRKTGKPIYNAIVWQDRRTAAYCQTIKPHEDTIRAKTGLLCDPYFSGTKLRWILDNADDTDDVMFGTIDSFLIYRLTGNHVTDATNASRTMLFNIHTQQWDDDICTLMNIPKSALPTVLDSNGDFGTTDIFGAPMPIRAVLGDQHAALFGQACFKSGMVKSTYGTGCFALMNTGDICTPSQNRLLNTVAWRIDGKTTYAIEGSIFVAGAAVQFLRDNLGMIKSAPDSETLAATVPDTGGVIFVPALTGLGAPYWDPDARGAIFGLSRGTTTAHIARACLEAQAYQTRDLMQAMESDTGLTLETLRVDGGLSRNDMACGMIADTLGVTVERPTNTETTAWGVAALAGIQVGLIDGQGGVTALWQSDRKFTPSQKPNQDDGYSEWKRAISRIMT